MAKLQTKRPPKSPIERIDFTQMPEFRLQASPLDYDAFIDKNPIWADMMAFFQANVQMGLVTFLNDQDNDSMRATQAQLKVYNVLLSLADILKQEATDQLKRDLANKKP